jgi:hypothetical protein
VGVFLVSLRTHESLYNKIGDIFSRPISFFANIFILGGCFTGDNDTSWPHRHRRGSKSLICPDVPTWSMTPVRRCYRLRRILVGVNYIDQERSPVWLTPGREQSAKPKIVGQHLYPIELIQYCM